MRTLFMFQAIIVLAVATIALELVICLYGYHLALRCDLIWAGLLVLAAMIIVSLNVLLLFAWLTDKIVVGFR